MTLSCDICSKPVESGQPRMGVKGTGDKSGSKFGEDRHYFCHTEKYGQPVRLSAVEREKATPIRQRTILTPKVAKGPYNRSENAQRQAEVLKRVDVMGKSRILIECPFCYQHLWAYIWSLCGGGKKCPNCGAIHGGTLMASPIEGNEELEDAH